MYRYYWGFGAFFGIINALFWILLAMLLVRLVRSGHHGHGYWHHGHGDNNHQSPLDYLKERYAKGEIDKAEYDRVRKDLES